MTENRSLEELARMYGAYFDHFEAQHYSPLVNPETRRDYRAEAKHKMVKYAVQNMSMPELEAAVEYRGYRMNYKRWSR